MTIAVSMSLLFAVARLHDWHGDPAYGPRRLAPLVPLLLQPIAWGAGPRAVQFLILGGKARALLRGRTHVSTDDIQALAKPVLRHRLVVNFAAQSDGVSADKIIDRLISSTPTKEDELTSDARFKKIFAS